MPHYIFATNCLTNALVSSHLQYCNLSIASISTVNLINFRIQSQS